MNDTHQARPRRARAGVVATIAALLLPLGAGCGANRGTNSPENFDAGMLEEVGELYRTTASRLRRPPGSLKDLAGGKEMFLLGYNAVARGDIVVYWGVTPAPGDQPTDEVLAYKADVPTAGGPALLTNTTIRPMNADQFRAAPKPPGKTSK